MTDRILIVCPTCSQTYAVESTLLRANRNLRCTRCQHVWPVDSSGEVQRKRERCNAVNDVLDRLRQSTNAWEIVRSVPARDAIGFVLEEPLFHYLADPGHDRVPRGALGFCVFHKDFRPASREQDWHVAPDRSPAYVEGDDRNAFAGRAEEALSGAPHILYGSAMEIACRTLLDRLGYQVEAYKKTGKRQNGIDVLGTMRKDWEEEESDGHVLALECKTTMQHVGRANRILLTQASAALKKVHDTPAVEAMYSAVRAHHGEYDYLFATNRDFKPPVLGEREGHFILRGIQLER